MKESGLKFVRILGFPLLLHYLLDILALVLAARDIGAADSRRALAIGFVIRIILRVSRIAVIVFFKTLIRCRPLFLLIFYIQGTRRFIMTRVLSLLAVLLISGLL